MKRNSINYLPVFLLFIASLLYAGCIKIPEKEVIITLSVSQNSLNFISSGGAQPFMVTSNDEWYVRNDASWITVSPEYNSEEVLVTVDRNTSSSSRNATITVESKVLGVSSQSISVTQTGVATTAQIRFRKDGVDSLYIRMGVGNLSGEIVASYNFGSSSGTSNYNSVTAGSYVPAVYHTNYGWQYYFNADDGSFYTVYLEAGYRYTFRLYDSIDNDGVF